MEKAVVRKQEPIVFVDGSKIVTDSLAIAREYGKQHKNVLQKIERSIEKCKKFGITELIFKPSEYKDSTGKLNRKYFLNRDAYLEVAVTFTGDRAFQLRIVFIKAFNRLEAFQNKKDHNHDYIQARQEGKFIRHDETDVLKILINYAVESGCSDGFIKNCYTNYTNMVNNALFVIPKGHKKVRESLEEFQLRRVAVAEELVGRLVLEEIAIKSNYKEIYYICKDKIVALGEVVGRTYVPQSQIENGVSEQLQIFQIGKVI